MTFILFIAIGGAAGLIARLILPGSKTAGAYVLAAVLGLLGPVLATFIGRAAGLYEPGESSGLIGAIVGAAILVGVAELIALLIRRTAPKTTEVRQEPVTAPAPRMPSADITSKLERLANLRNSGAIEEAEFQRLKADALGTSTPTNRT